MRNDEQVAWGDRAIAEVADLHVETGLFESNDEIHDEPQLQCAAKRVADKLEAADLGTALLTDGEPMRPLNCGRQVYTLALCQCAAKVGEVA
ncbi:hypothetical protein ABNF93_01255 [Actinopolymorpha sp. B9G3]